MTLVANEEVGGRNGIKAIGESVNGSDLNGAIKIHGNTGTDNAERNVEVGEGFGSLVDKFMPVNEENRTFTFYSGLTNHPTCGVSFTCAARSDGDDALFTGAELLANGVNQIELIRPELNISHGRNLLTSLAKCEPP